MKWRWKKKGLEERGDKSLESVRRIQLVSQQTLSVYLIYIEQCAGSGRCSGGQENMGLLGVGPG